jgi:hypothetical protein
VASNAMQQLIAGLSGDNKLRRLALQTSKFFLAVKD